MNKDFWERIDRLEELAEKATQGEWVISTDDGIDWGNLYVTTEDRHYADMVEIAQVDNAFLRTDEIHTDFQKEQNANACYIAAANPLMIKEMIAELRMLEKEVDWLAKEMGECNKENSTECSYPFQYEMCSVCWRETARKAVEEARADEN